MNTHIDELKAELEEELNVEDDAIERDELGVARYDITSYGIDFDVDGLVKRIKRGDVFIPPFQRNFVWKLPESSRLIESILLGLPVPGIFLAQEAETGKMLVIDGQQRLLSLFYFFEGYFNFKEDDEKRRVFRLDKVQRNYEGKTFSTLDSKDRINLENSVIHATVVKQDAPAGDDTSIYHIFERLNSGGRKLVPQEIRTAVYHGHFINLVKDLNQEPSWRKIYGKINERLKDQELIMRFFAMLEGHLDYKKPMTDFITRFTKKHRHANSEVNGYAACFVDCCRLFESINNGKPFRIGNALNVAFFEAAMVGLAQRIRSKGIPQVDLVRKAYDGLRNNSDFMNAISQSTGDPSSVRARMEIAIRFFDEA